MEQTDSCRKRGWGEWWKEEEGTSQRKYMNDTCSWTMEKGLTVGYKGGLSGGGQKEKNGTIVIE